MIKLYCNDSGDLLYSRNWPKEPPVMISIYADQMVLNQYKNDLDYLLRYPIYVENQEQVINLIGKVEPRKFYELDAVAVIKGPNLCRVDQIVT